jgi:prepilin-type processing-associated H-X9-DG protein
MSVTRPGFGRPTALAVLVAVLQLWVATPPAAHGQPLADRVPADAILYVGTLGYGTKGPGYEGSHLQAVLDAAQFQQLVDETIPALLRKIAEKDRRAAEGFAIAKPILLPLLKYPSAVWVGTPDLAAGQEPKPRAGLLSQAGPDADAMLQHLNDLLKNAPPQVVDLVKVSKAGDAVAVTIGYAPGRAPAAPGAGLSASASFKAILPHAVPNASFFVYADVAQLVATVDKGMEAYGEPEVKSLWGKAKTGIGFGSVKHFVWSSGFDGKEWLDHVFLHAPEPRQGLVALADPAPLSDAALKSIPVTATRAGATKFDVSKAIAGIRKAINDVEPQATEQIDKAFAQASKAIGMDVQKDLLDAVGDEWVYYTDPMTGGRGLGGLVLVNRLRDAKKAEAAFGKLEKLVNDELAKNIKEKDVAVRFLTTQAGGTTVHYLGTPLLSPAWAVKDGYLVVGLYPQIVAGAADHLAAGGKSILDNPAYQAVRKRLGVTTASAVAFADLAQTLPDAYATWVAVSRLSGFADVFGIPAPAMLLPPLPKLLPHMTPAGQVTWTDKDGIHMKAISPFPGATLIATDPLGGAQMTAPIMASVLLPALAKAREQGNRIKSASNLRQIGLMAMMYANENNRNGGKFPPTLAELVVKGGASPDAFVSPRRDGTAPPHLLNADPAVRGRWVEENSHYAYVGAGLTSAAGPDVVLAYEKWEGLDDGINVLFADGHVEWLPTSVAQERIERQQREMKLRKR